MAIALVGTIGAVSTGAASAAVTPAWGTSENRTAANLLVLSVAVTGTATFPATPSGWTLANVAGGTISSSAIYYRVATGSDAAPTVAAITNGTVSARLAEYSGTDTASPLETAASVSGTTSPLTATGSHADGTSGSLLVSSTAIIYSGAATKTITPSFNNATATSVTNAAVSTASHYAFSYGVTTTNASTDTATITYTVTSISGMVQVFASFKPAAPPINQTAFRFDEDGTETGSVAIAAQSTNITRDVSVNSNLLLRVRLQAASATAGLTTDDYQLQYSKNGGQYQNVNITSTVVDQAQFSGTSGSLGRVFGGSGVEEAEGQSFTAVSTGLITKVAINLWKGGTLTDNLVLEILSGSFTGTVIATSSNLAASTVTPTSNNASIPYSFTFPSGASVTSGTKYYLRLTRTGARDLTNFVGVGGEPFNNLYANGGASTRSSGSWSAESTTTDAGFVTYISPPIGTEVIGFNSANLTDAGATSNRLGAGTGSFVAGKISEDGLLDDHQITASNYTEHLYSLTLVSSALANTDTLDFRVLRNGSALNSYTVTPRITVSNPSGVNTTNFFAMF